MNTRVEAILEQIERLDEVDRLALEQELGKLAEVEWQREAESVRAITEETGIDQRKIDDVVEKLRYGL